MSVFPAHEPIASGRLPVSGGNEIYWETSGNPDGTPLVHLHGGPGSGAGSWYRQLYDPSTFLIVSFDQRGCGRSRPLASEDPALLPMNTTAQQIADIEALREHLRVDAWLVSGLSWGSTLALAYAEAHPRRVTAMVLAAVATTTAAEVEWITEGVGRIFPREWDEFATAAQARPGQRIIDAYYERITDPDPFVRERAARAWCTWEDVHVSLAHGFKPSARFDDPGFRLLFATLVIHYFAHSGFPDAGGIWANLERIRHIPVVLIHGRLDISSPLATAWNLHKQWPGSRLVVIDDEGHGGGGMFEALSLAASGLARQLR
ncbi:prolyl aminopeptidase [Cryobacterium tepidiphilum]|uniref:Proline iminopeptidase n=1 Tax=Cryobacterium tepidiphilum TaxID=2486026 RepID=A0A3M8LGS1_9MICO|nr:prolyl aminopeptidase [Cryobacterium tepidiphilum]